MIEIRSEVQCELVEIQCERCKKGNLYYQTAAERSGQTVLVHKCKSCLRSFDLDTRYPHVEYKRADGSTVVI